LKLVIEAAHKAGIIADDPNAMHVEGGFLLRSNAGEENSLKKIKVGSRFYLYVDEFGDISQTGGVFKHDPSGNEVTNQGAFRDAASQVFILEPRRSLFGSDNQQALHRESMFLKGSRLFPTYIEIKKVQLDTYDLGGRVIPYAYVTGRIYRVKDPALDYLNPEEKTRFGKGIFDPNNVKALPNGNFINLVLSPYAVQIEKLVNEQIEAFNHYSTLYSEVDVDPAQKEVWVSKYEHTRKLLKPHANEIYKYEKGNIYYINTSGNWQSESVAGLRSLDVDDRDRISRHLATNNINTDLKKTLSSKSLREQQKLSNIASALQPYVNETRKKDLDSIDRRIKKTATLKPTDGPLGANDLPGLKKNVVLFPHQSMLLASLKDRDRMLIDADPGAGKAFVIIADILQQMKAYKVKRPLVVMPDSLLTQFAREVKEFSELNPWIISTDSIKNWGKTGDIPEFIADARRAPRNTVFLTSYTWISLEYDNQSNGEISESSGKIKYKTSKVFNRVNILLNSLGIDAVWQDECHILRGNSNMAKAASGLAEVPIVRGLTGTVMPGNPYDATGPMSVIHSSVFGTSDDFIKEHTVNGSINEYQTDAPKKIRNKLKNFGVVSVRKSAWAHLLPKVHRETEYAEFTEDQKKAYSALLSNILDEIRNDPKLSVLLKKIEDALADGDEITAGPLLARFTPLDVFLNSPAEAKDWLKSLMVGDNAISPKAKVINEIIHKHLTNPDAGKVLVFVQYKEAAKNILDHLDPDLKEMAAYYEGGMTDVLTRFKTPQDPLRILIGVDKSLVTGHNIQAANCIINADLKWLPGDMYQRESRAARIGQKRDVYIHNVLVKGTAEILKQARLISAEHMITKANSDFTDNKVLQPIQMSLSNMQSFTKDSQLHPYLERKKEIDAHVEAQSIKDKDVYGPTMMKPHGYADIANVFKEAKTLKKVPSSKDFIGDAKDYDALITQDLTELPEDPKHPKLLTLDLYQWDRDWYLFSYKSADPDGFLRRLGFSLMRGYYYIELASKAGVDNIIVKLEKNLTITNKPEFEKQVREARVVSSGVKSGLRKAAQKQRAKVAAATEAKDLDFIDKSKSGEVSLQFSIMDGAPVIWIYNVLTSSDPELSVIKRSGFELEPPFWKKPITRSQVKIFLTKLNSNYPQVRIANWDDFKDIAHQAFKGLDLSEFDFLAEKKK
jgi:SNF2 family DNA or RNA helicase